jgi:hypothetical protein
MNAGLKFTRTGNSLDLSRTTSVRYVGRREKNTAITLVKKVKTGGISDMTGKDYDPNRN